MMDDTQIPDAPLEEPVETAPPTLPEDLPGTTIPGSTYELVVVAAREARRINDRLRRLVTEKEGEKVTTRAIERVLAGQVRFAYEEDTGA